MCQFHESCISYLETKHIIIFWANTIIYLDKQAICLEARHVNKHMSKGFVWVGFFNNSFFSLTHTYINLNSWFYFLHLFPTNQTSNNIKLLARNRLHTNKQKLSSQKQLRCSHLPIQPSLPPLPGPTKQPLSAQLPWKTLEYLIFISRKGRGFIPK